MYTSSLWSGKPRDIGEEGTLVYQVYILCVKTYCYWMEQDGLVENLGHSSCTS